ncbi:MAG: hypothetical protein OXH97_05500 [Chloroflexota bacterium]|nr:hypothetical protein [Chloroflexota bacterium]
MPRDSERSARACLRESRGATEASIARVQQSIAKLGSDFCRAIWLETMVIIGAIVAATGIILAAMRIWT